MQKNCKIRPLAFFRDGMKKLVFLGFATVALVGCSSHISNSNQLIGDWRCTIDYDDFNIRTVDNMRFSANGNLVSQGTVNYPIQKPIFIYSVNNNGRWTLTNNRIVYRLFSESVQRNHNATIWSELQKDKELQQYEESLFGTISDNDTNRVIELMITGFSANKMEVKQEIKAHRAYKGLCVKK